ncbi:hypothetical protein PaecuDRAFT_1460 [Paenibacillus curdlanolyticus YK9]|uniref:LTXXQ motif family protein n=1 Tax=Paenibacillus curdlanolyticus YK9 TaxID=717606 RepID=E0I736_9BACL|nr:hypothetical protein [Paenibacillus curdlanolyticus]EFM11852.1 hypothetical protein PaecuDRAFT_1460 [Paenibacillus curdlanolyticus YK9]
MTLRTKGLAFGISAALLLTAIPSIAGAAAVPEEQTRPGAELRHQEEVHGPGHGFGHGRHDEKHRLERLQYVARYFDIKTDGKDGKQLYEEIQAAKKANPQKWEAFKAEHRAKFEERIKEAARYFGIATEGKSVEQLHKELRAAREANPEKWKAFILEKRNQFDANKRRETGDSAKKNESATSNSGRSM